MIILSCWSIKRWINIFQVKTALTSYDLFIFWIIWLSKYCWCTFFLIQEENRMCQICGKSHSTVCWLYLRPYFFRKIGYLFQSDKNSRTIYLQNCNKSKLFKEIYKLNFCTALFIGVGKILLLDEREAGPFSYQWFQSFTYSRSPLRVCRGVMFPPHRKSKWSKY